MLSFLFILAGKIYQIPSDKVDYPLISSAEPDFQTEDLPETSASRGVEDEQPHKKATLAAKYGMAALTACRREHHSKHQWEDTRCRATDKACRPTVTSPASSVRLSRSFSNIQKCLEDQQRRSQDLIPPHVSIGSQKSDKSLLSCLPLDDEDEEEVVNDAPFSPVSRNQARDVEEPAKTTNPCRSEASRTEQVPTWLNKSYLRRLAEKHRTSICGSRASCRSFEHDSSSFDTNSRSPRSTLPSIRHSDVATEEIPVFPTSLGLPRMDVARANPRQSTQQQQESTQDMIMVEVCPGLSVPLRGSEATKTAVANNWYTPVTCFGCATQIYCIADVSYSICPLCRIVSPVEEDIFRGEVISRRWGLGLGFTDENLFEMHTEIATARSAEL